MAACPACGEDEDLTLVQKLEGTARVIRCDRCGNEWQRGELPPRVEPGATTEERLRAKFPTAAEIPTQRLVDLDARAEGFSSGMPIEEKEFRDRYQRAFSQAHLPSLTAEDFKEFYRSQRIAGLGFGGWAPDHYFNQFDPEQYMKDIREAIGYLLYGPKGTLESRLSDLIYDRSRVGVPGIKETVLTKVLAVAIPDRVHPFATYDSPGGGKRQIAEKVLDLRLPRADATDWAIGRLIIWSSDLFAEVSRRWWDELWVGAVFLWSLWEDPGFPGSSAEGGAR